MAGSGAVRSMNERFNSMRVETLSPTAFVAHGASAAVALA
jgi:hypothetical protein